MSRLVKNIEMVLKIKIKVKIDEELIDGDEGKDKNK